MLELADDPANQFTSVIATTRTDLDKKSISKLAIRKLSSSKRWALGLTGLGISWSLAIAFIFIPVIMCLVVYYLSQVEDAYRDMAIAGYIIFSFGVFFFLVMLISMAMSEEKWDPFFTGAAEWASGGAFLAMICLIPGQMSHQ